MEHLRHWMVIGIEMFAAKNPGTEERSCFLEDSWVCSRRFASVFCRNIV
jgi:hypothetical protein